MGLLDTNDIDDDGFDEADDESKSYLYMEVESTSNFLGFDIDKMLAHTSIEDFMKQIYSAGASKKVAEMGGSKGLANQSSIDIVQKLLESSDAMIEEEKVQEDKGPTLDFDDETQSDKSGLKAMSGENALKQQALENLRLRRLRLKTSSIFNKAD